MLFRSKPVEPIQLEPIRASAPPPHKSSRIFYPPERHLGIINRYHRQSKICLIHYYVDSVSQDCIHRDHISYD